MGKFKLLIVIDSFGAGGAEVSTKVLCDFLAQKNIEFEILCLDKTAIGVQEYMISQGYTIHFLNNLNFYKQVKYIKDLILSKGFDIVHSILFRSNLRVRLVRFSCSFVHLESLVNTTYSDLRYNDPKVNNAALRIYHLIDKFTAKKGVDHFHSITESVKKHYVQKLGLPPEKITVIYRGRSSCNVDSKISKESLGFCSSDFLIINTGRHEYQKGQIFLVRALDQLKSRGYANIKLLILGREGKSTDEIKDYIKKFNLEDTVKLAGFRDDVPVLLRSGDLFAFPSLYEGLGGALIEAQAAGLPIICNDLEVLKEVVLENENAKFFKSEDIDGICQQILFFYASENKQKEFGTRSLENFRNKFQLSEINHKMLSLYQSLVP